MVARELEMISCYHDDTSSIRTNLSAYKSFPLLQNNSRMLTKIHPSDLTESNGDLQWDMNMMICLQKFYRCRF